MVEGQILPSGMQAKEIDAVGFQTHCPGTPYYGKHHIGIANHTQTVQCPGKVKDGIMYYGYGGKEHMTRIF
jgi:hypothetical protein